jgi:hypothetical protein
MASVVRYFCNCKCQGFVIIYYNLFEVYCYSFLQFLGLYACVVNLGGVVRSNKRKVFEVVHGSVSRFSTYSPRSKHNWILYSEILSIGVVRLGFPFVPCFPG